MDSDKLSGFITQLEELTSKPEKYLSLQEAEAEKLKVLTRNLYNFTKENESRKYKDTNALEKLMIKNLDEEQIWQQIEIQNNSMLDKLVHDVSNLLGKKDTLKFPLKKKKKKEQEQSSPEKKGKKEKEQSNSKIKSDKKLVKEVKDVKTKKALKRPALKSSVVDDKFFKLYEMENFLEKIEKGEENFGNDDDDEIDYFEDDSSDKNNYNARQLHYSDFFDQPEGEDQEDNNAVINGKSNKENFHLEDDEEEKIEDEGSSSESLENNETLNFDDAESDTEEDEDEDEDEDNLNNFNEMENDDAIEEDDEDEVENFDNCNSSEKDFDEKPSTFEARQERLKTRIQNLEEELLAEKPWQLKGEVTASSRPQNSLLEEYVEFDIAARPAPVLTEKSTLKLEDIIIQRIKDKAWDDVVRKIKPVENEIEYKKKLILDQEKSKLSLAQIYEQEYLKQLDNKNEDWIDKPEMEAPEHQEIRIMINKLFSKLDALSNFHFTPKQVAPELKVISNLPAINMEEVAPVATSDATLLAPEEVKSKSKGDLIGKTERTSTDKKRERRQKKIKQKLKYKQLEAKEKLKLEKSGTKDSKDKKVSLKFLQKITKSRNVSQLDNSDSGKYVKSSNTFFSRLQDETNVVNPVGKKKSLGLNKINKDKKFNSKKLNTS